ncbi:MAG: hypothetical protein L6420_00185 [Elusimicrobia bacterium]|nr:hypothetical protein [Elusimicrobiota bacterium]
MDTFVEIFHWAYFPFLLAHFAVLFFFCLRFRCDIASPFMEINKKSLAALALIFLFGLYLRVGMSGRYGLDDLLWEHAANAESFYKTFRFTNFLHPGGHSFLATLSFLFGRNVENISRLTIFLDSLSVCLIFFFSFRIFRKTEISLLASLIMAILPWQIFMSGMGLDVTSSLFFVLAAVLILLISVESGSDSLLTLSLLVLIWSANIRVENLLLSPFFLLFYYCRKGLIHIRKRFVWLISFFCMPALIWLAYSPFKFGTSSAVEGAGFQHFVSIHNLLINYRDCIIPHFMSPQTCYPHLIFFFFVIGTIRLVWPSKRRTGAYIIIVWVLFWSAVYGGYWHGDQIYRYSILIHPVLALVSACGAYWLMQQIKGTNKGIFTFAARALVSGFIVFSAFSVRQIANPSPLVFWPSVREFKSISTYFGEDSCVMLQRLKYGRFENALKLIGEGKKFIEWPAGKDIFSYKCPDIYYFDLRKYAHPIPADMRIYDENHAFLSKKYELEKFVNNGPLDIYKVIKKKNSHGGKTGRFESLKLVALEYAFMLDLEGIKK